LKISLAQISYHTGNFEKNTEKIIKAIEKAKSLNSDLVVFAELGICGYPARDFLDFKDFITLSYKCIDEIAAHCHGIAAIVGAPKINPVPEGKDLFNSAYFLADGAIKQVVHKSLLPNYDIFDEYRYFEPNNEFKVVEYLGHKIALTICEDLWNLNENPMYVHCPLDILMDQKPDFIINIAASPYSKTQIETRRAVLIENCKEYNLPLFYVNHIGGQTHLVFDGGSCVLDSKGKVYDELKYFEEDFKTYEFSKDDKSSPKLIDGIISKREKINKYQDVENALVLGVKEYFLKTGFTKIILGLSGGIDSALVLYLAVKALGNSNVKALLLPSRYSTNHSLSDAIDCAKNLDVSYEIIRIDEAFEAFEKTLYPFFKGTSFDYTEENLQSRARGMILMAMSNKFGYILLNTSNKSELAVGYGTLYGDMCGGLSIIGDLYKTEVFELCEYINRNNEIIPRNILTKAPSAELRPDQKDTDTLPDYNILDEILFLYLEKSKGPSEIIAAGYDEELVKRILRMVNTNEWKRWQAPPIIRISQKAFGPGRRVPISGKYLS